jgi:hypothetical protein
LKRRGTLGTLNCTVCCLCAKDRCGRPTNPGVSDEQTQTGSVKARSQPQNNREGPPSQSGSNEPPPDRHKDSKREATLVENQATALQEDFKQTLRENNSKSGFDFSSVTANVRAYQAKLLEMAQANIQLAFEFNQRLATIRSPFEVLSVIAEFTGKRIAMFGKYSKEMAELSIKR